VVRAPSVAPPAGFDSVSFTVSLPEAPAGRIGMGTVLVVSPAAKTSVVTVAV
jgi:hypothetical protein